MKQRQGLAVLARLWPRKGVLYGEAQRCSERSERQRSRRRAARCLCFHMQLLKLTLLTCNSANGRCSHMLMQQPLLRSAARRPQYIMTTSSGARRCKKTILLDEDGNETEELACADESAFNLATQWLRLTGLIHGSGGGRSLSGPGAPRLGSGASRLQ